jgi:hypothetical protein
MGTRLARYAVRRSELVRSLSNPISGRVVFTDPHLAPDTARYSASDLFGIPPNDLRVVAARSATTVGSVIVFPGFRRPLVDDLRRRRMRAGHLEQVLAIWRLLTMGKLIF